MKFERNSKPNKIPDYISISKSTVEGAGDGAFTKVFIPKGKTIGEYVGKVFEGPDLNKANGDYLFSVLKKGKEIKIIDGKNKKLSSWVRYVNTPQSQDEGNAYFFQYNSRIFLRTSRDIPIGQEIFAYYGDEYINEKLKKYFTKDNKPKIK